MVNLISFASDVVAVHMVTINHNSSDFMTVFSDLMKWNMTRLDIKQNRVILDLIKTTVSVLLVSNSQGQSCNVPCSNKHQYSTGLCTSLPPTWKETVCVLRPVVLRATDTILFF